jgi:hypothetical protein
VGRLSSIHFWAFKYNNEVTVVRCYSLLPVPKPFVPDAGSHDRPVIGFINLVATVTISELAVNSNFNTFQDLFTSR